MAACSWLVVLIVAMGDWEWVAESALWEELVELVAEIYFGEVVVMCSY